MATSRKRVVTRVATKVKAKKKQAADSDDMAVVAQSVERGLTEGCEATLAAACERVCNDVSTEEQAERLCKHGMVALLVQAVSEAPVPALYALQSLVFFGAGRKAFSNDACAEFLADLLNEAVGAAHGGAEGSAGAGEEDEEGEEAEEEAEEEGAGVEEEEAEEGEEEGRCADPRLVPALRLVGNACADSPRFACRLIRLGVLDCCVGCLAAYGGQDGGEEVVNAVAWAVGVVCFTRAQMGVFGRLAASDPNVFFGLAAAAVRAEEEEEGEEKKVREDTEAGLLFAKLVTDGVVPPSTLLRVPGGQGVGVCLALARGEGGPASQQAARVCVLACCAEEEGVAELLSGSVPLEDGAAALLALAAESPRMAGVLLGSEEHLEALETHMQDEVAEFCEASAAPPAAAPPAKRRKKQKGGGVEEEEEGLRGALRRAAGQEEGTAGGLCPWDEGGYALASARQGDVVFSKVGVFGPVTVTRHGNWYCLRFGEVEQGLTYVGSPGEPGYANGRAISRVIGYDYIKGMASAYDAWCGGARANPAGVVVNVGLGSGALANYVAKEAAPYRRVVCFEIDPVVVEAAEVMRVGSEVVSGVVVSDALEGMRTMDKASAAAVLLDAYDSVGGIPAHLRAASFLSEVGRVLEAGGAAIANLHNGPVGSRDRAQAAEYVRLLQKHVGAVFLVKLPSQQSNLIAVALKPGRKTRGPAPSAASNTFKVGEGAADEDGLPSGLWGSPGAK